MTEALTDRRYSPQCLYADSAYEYAEYMKPSEILNKIYCVLVHIEKIWYNKCRAFIINQNALHIRLPLANSAHIGKLYHNLAIMV